MRILRFFFLLRFYCGSVGFLLLLSTWLLTTFDSLGFSPGRCRPVNGPSSAAVNSRQSHTAAHWLPAPAGCSLHRISPSSSTYIIIAYLFISPATPSAMSLQVAAFNRVLGNRSSSGFKHNAMFHPGWFLCSLSRSVAEFITGVRYLYYAAISASRSHIRISLSRVSPEPRAFALLRLHLKDGAPKKLWLQPHSKRPAQQPPRHFGFLVALPLVRFKETSRRLCIVHRGI